MIIALTILQNAVQAAVDVMDKFLLSKRKIEPVSYTFFTVVTGAAILVIWPWVFEGLPGKFVALNLLSGAFFSLTYYFFFKTLSFGEVSRVIPFIFGLVPVFDLLLAAVTGRNTVNLGQVAALSALIPGAVLLTYHPGMLSIKHIILKVFCAFLFASYNSLWNFSAQTGPFLNNFMWNRLGAAAVLVLLLLWPVFRKKVFTFSHVPEKKHTSFLFLFKQMLGGANFIFLSFLLAAGNIIIVDSLQGFRYAFLFLFGLILSKHAKKILDEKINKKIMLQKSFAIVLLFLGTIMLFVY